MALTRRKRFEGFSQDLEQYLKNHPALAFYGYGSYFQHPLNENPGDFDGGIIAPTLITDKKEVDALSNQIADNLKKHDLKSDDLQLNLIDRESARDGRFLSYTSDYSRFIRKHAAHFTKNVDLEDLTEIDNRFGIQHAVAFNFRSIRNSYLMLQPLMRESAEKAHESLQGAITKVKSLPRKLVCLDIYRTAGEAKYDQVIEFLARTDKDDALREMPRIVGKDAINCEFFQSSNDAKEITADFATALQTYEMLISGFIRKNPPKEVVVKTTI